jgi:hypothetical protein
MSAAAFDDAFMGGDVTQTHTHTHTTMTVVTPSSSLSFRVANANSDDSNSNDDDGDGDGDDSSGDEDDTGGESGDADDDDSNDDVSSALSTHAAPLVHRRPATMSMPPPATSTSTSAVTLLCYPKPRCRRILSGHTDAVIGVLAMCDVLAMFARYASCFAL